MKRRKRESQTSRNGTADDGRKSEEDGTDTKTLKQMLGMTCPVCRNKENQTL